MNKLDEAAARLLFSEARSQNGWLPGEVSDGQLLAAYDVAKWGPTSMNAQPLRALFLRSSGAKDRLRPALSPGNIERAMSAPVLAVFAYDLEFYEHLSAVFPHNLEARNNYLDNEGLAFATAFRNATLQAAYMMIALRAEGLDVGPMSGFDATKVDAEFFAGSTWRANFLCGIGIGDKDRIFPRLPRFGFEEIARIL